MSNNIGRRVEMDPLDSFAFKVEIDGLEVARFNNVDGLNYEAEMIEYRSSNNPNLPKFRQGRRKAGHLTLKRGILVGGGSNPLFDWIREVEAGTITPRNIAISIGRYGRDSFDQAVDETKGGKQQWQLLQCRPTKWGLSTLDSNSSNALIETLELAVEEVKQ